MAPVLKTLPKESSGPAALTLAIPIAASTGMIQTKNMVKVGLILGIISGVLGYVLIRIFPF